MGVKKWKSAFFVCLTFLIVSNVYLFYQLLDSGMTNTYTSDTLEKQDETIRLLGDIIVEEGKGYSQKDVLFLLRQKYQDGFIVEDSNRISYEGIEFIFQNDSLINIADVW